MALKAVLDSVDGLDDEVKSFYVEHEGKYRLDVEDGFKTTGEIDGLVSALNKERDARGKLEKNLKTFDGIEDPVKAVKALETLKNLDQKKLIDTGEVERVKAEVAKAMQSQIDELQTSLDDKETLLTKELIGGRFSRSKFIAEKLLIPPDMAEHRFGSSFKIEDGRVVAHDQHGNKIYSKTNPGEVAGFEEALTSLVDAYAYKDSIFKGSQSSGSGAGSGSAGAGMGAKTMVRTQFEELNDAERMAFIKGKGKVVDK